MVHVLDIKSENNEVHEFALISDIHLDNPKCNRKKLIKDLEHCKNRGIKILINGDTFCAMEGRHDRRRSRNVYPAHNFPDYLDRIVDDAVEVFKPYAHLILLVGYGNHETSVLKNTETDLLKRFVRALDIENTLGGYGGWFVFRGRYKHGKTSHSYRLKYYHGTGGGGIVTRGAIGAQRQLASVHNMDAAWQGHIHESWAMTNCVERLTDHNTIELKEVLHIRTPTYKEEYGDGAKGWHIERGGPPKALGCYILRLKFKKSGWEARAFPL